MATPEKCPDHVSPYLLTARKATVIAEQIAVIAENLRKTHPGMSMTNCVDTAIAAWDLVTIADASE